MREPRQLAPAAGAAAALVLHLFATAAAAQQADVVGLQRVLDDQQTVIAAQATQLDTLKQQIETLRQRLDETAAIAQSASKQLAELRAQTPPDLPSQLEALQQAVKRLPELPEKVVTAGEFPGSISVPGTSAALKFGGQIQFNLVHTFQPLGTDDKFVASSIPVDVQQAGEGARTTYTANPTRLNLDLRGPTPIGAVRTFVEGDFAGTGATVRLRHAFLQLDHWIFGQTWSTFSDPEVQPTDIDFEGENALSRFRQAQVRYTKPLRDRLDLSVSVENPAPDLSGAEGVNLTPDVIARLRWEPENPQKHLLAEATHVQGAVLIRTLRGQLSTEPDVTLSTGGFGGTVSGVLVPGWDADDHIKFASYGGWGIGRYITDLSAAGGQDAVYDPTSNSLRALPVAASYIAYEHRWRATFMSSITYGVVAVHNLDIQPPTALNRTQRATANLAWTPMTRGEFVVEYLTGTRVNKNGDRGASNQFQAGWKLRF